MKGSTAWMALILCVVLCALKAALFHYLARSHIVTDPSWRSLQTKTIPVVAMVIEETKHFQMDDDEEWASLSPNNGIVHIDNEPFTIAMFHQLRCLDVIRKGIVDLQDTGNTISTPATPSPLQRHCINYMRQTVLCRNDVDLDQALGNPVPNAYPDGYMCRDWRVPFVSLSLTLYAR
ncbi:hypothetical protein ONZ45_g12778 [Pleurotus djamor]|nr:hypothetical protein ONZ45_g12778 [Pleurotus djamor]